MTTSFMPNFLNDTLDTLMGPIGTVFHFFKKDSKEMENIDILRAKDIATKLKTISDAAAKYDNMFDVTKHFVYEIITSFWPYLILALGVIIVIKKI